MGKRKKVLSIANTVQCIHIKKHDIGFKLDDIEQAITYIEDSSEESSSDEEDCTSLSEPTDSETTSLDSDDFEDGDTETNPTSSHVETNNSKIVDLDVNNDVEIVRTGLEELMMVQ